MKTPMRVLGITRSLRRGSYHRAALRAATELALKDATVETFEFDGIPLLNQEFTPLKSKKIVFEIGSFPILEGAILE